MLQFVATNASNHNILKTLWIILLLYAVIIITIIIVIVTTITIIVIIIIIIIYDNVIREAPSVLSY